MAPLRRSALQTRPNTLGHVPEVAVFEQFVRVEDDARAPGRGTSARLPARADIARIVLVVLGLGAAIAILSLFGRLMPSESRQQSALGVGADPDCTSLGRGGTYCVKNPLNSTASSRNAGPREGCTSLGRGGLVCMQRPANADRPNQSTGA
jgi:hypothetical protein